jgi:hypothetical protein
LMISIHTLLLLNYLHHWLLKRLVSYCTVALILSGFNHIKQGNSVL